MQSVEVRIRHLTDELHILKALEVYTRTTPPKR
jgi:hypothetical protein